MSSSKKSPDDQVNTTHLMVGAFLDTTWRMFVPVLGATLIGWLVDKQAGTRPVGILIGLGVGVLGSGFLTYRLYKKVTNTVHTKERTK